MANRCSYLTLTKKSSWHFTPIMTFHPYILGLLLAHDNYKWLIDWSHRIFMEFEGAVALYGPWTKILDHFCPFLSIKLDLIFFVHFYYISTLGDTNFQSPSTGLIQGYLESPSYLGRAPHLTPKWINKIYALFRRSHVLYSKQFWNQASWQERNEISSAVALIPAGQGSAGGSCHLLAPSISDNGHKFSNETKILNIPSISAFKYFLSHTEVGSTYW